MRIIVISDIHGRSDEFKELLKKVNYQKGMDYMYLLGDYVDKGPKSKEVVQLVMELSKNEKVKVIGGNHDDLFLSWIDEGDRKRFPYTGDKIAGDKTILSFAPHFEKGINDEETRLYIQKEYEAEISFLKQLPYYIEDERHVYVHAGIDPKKEDWKDTSKKDFRWIRNRFYDQPHNHEKTIVFGHEATSLLHQDEQNFDVWYGHRKIGIDGGSKFGGQLNALIIEKGMYTSCSVKIPL